MTVPGAHQSADAGRTQEGDYQAVGPRASQAQTIEKDEVDHGEQQRRQQDQLPRTQSQG